MKQQAKDITLDVLLCALWFVFGLIAFSALIASIALMWKITKIIWQFIV